METTEQTYTLYTRVDDSGAVLAGDRLPIGTYVTLDAARDALSEAVIPGVRGPGCMCIEDSDGTEYGYAF